MNNNSVNNILEQAYEYVSEDNVFLRLTTISTIVHSMIFVVIVAYNLTYTMSKIKHDRSNAIMKEVTTMIKQLVEIDGLL